MRVGSYSLVVAESALKGVEAKLERLPARRRELVEAALALVADSLLGERPQELRGFVDSPQPASSARRTNRARLEVLSGRVQSESVPGRELGRRLGISRQRLAQLRAGGRLVSFQPPFRTEHWYPDWQFDASGGVRPVVPDLLRASREARLSPLSLHLLLTNPDAGIDGRPLVDLLDERPDAVLELVGAGAEHGT
jgi:hypothetical protein